MVFIKTKESMRILGVVPFIKRQNDLNNSYTVQNDEKWDVEPRHFSVFAWALQFSCPVNLELVLER